MTNAIHAIIADSNLTAYQGRRLAMFKPGDDQSSSCPCGSKVHYSKPLAHESVVTVFCGPECYTEYSGDYLKIPSLLDEKQVVVDGEVQVKETKAKQCPECKGPSTRGKGWAHTPDCSLSTPNKLKQIAAQRKIARGNCPHCGGLPGRRKGWKHKEGCNRGIVKEAKAPRPACPECGGEPGRARGWKHKDGCAIVTKAREVGLEKLRKTSAAKRSKVKGRRKMPTGAV